MTIKEVIDAVDNLKPNQYTLRDKVQWLSFVDEVIINDVLKTHEGYDGRYDAFTGYTEEDLSVALIVQSPYDRLYSAFLVMKIDQENGEVTRYNNSASMFNSYMMEFRKYYNKTHMPLSIEERKNIKPVCKPIEHITEAQVEAIKRDLYYMLSDDLNEATSDDKIYDIVMKYVNNNVQMLKGKDGTVSFDKLTDGQKKSLKGERGEKGETGVYVGETEPADESVMVWVNPEGIAKEYEDGNIPVFSLDADGNLYVKYGEEAQVLLGNIKGKNGTSVTVTSVSESEDDSGNNVVTFSDGKTVTIKNGSKGTNGKDGYTPYIQGEYWYINGNNTGVKAIGKDGEDGVGITKIETEPHTSFNGGYYVNIHLSNGEITSFDIMNGNGIHHIESRRNDSDNGTLVEMFITDGTIASVEIPDGKDGYTPVKGTDYFTNADKQEMVNAVIAAMPKYEGSVS
jgi:hypothetical protein